MIITPIEGPNIFDFGDYPSTPQPMTQFPMILVCGSQLFQSPQTHHILSS